MDPGIYMGGGACTYCRGVCGPHFNTYILKILPKNVKKNTKHLRTFSTGSAAVPS